MEYPVPDYLRRWFNEAGDRGRVSDVDAQAYNAGLEADESGVDMGTPGLTLEESLSPEVIARIAEVLGNTRMWTPPAEWAEPAPARPPAPVTPPPQPLWSAGADYLRPSDEFGALRRTPGLGAAVPSEERSLSDRLRPPYLTPMPGANPANAGASRILEQGFGQLPPEVQRGLRIPGQRLNVAQSPEGAMPGGALETGAYPRTAWARSPEEMVRQLMREYQERGL